MSELPHNQPIGGASSFGQVAGLLQGLLVKGIVTFAAILLVLHVILPSPYKPGELLGGFVGSMIEAEQSKARASQAETARRMAEAQALWAMEVETARQQQASIERSVAGLESEAVAADYICISGPVAMAIWGRDAAGYAQTVQAACGAAAKLREQIVEAHARAARIGSAVMQRRPMGAAVP